VPTGYPHRVALTSLLYERLSHSMYGMDCDFYTYNHSDVLESA